MANTESRLLPLGPLMIDVAGLELTEAEGRVLLDHRIGGVILFARNIENRQQLIHLVSQIKKLRTPSLLISVDQEGGRVQRFKDGFSELPPAQSFGKLWDKNSQRGGNAAFESAYLMATELIDVGIDFSFAPVFDINSTSNEVIGDRSFHPNPEVASELLGNYIDGMHSAGMVACAKHFPGHGGVSGDSHHCLPNDSRQINDLMSFDLQPYIELVDEIDSVMTAHVSYSECDAEIATFSRYWIQGVLREKLGFKGVIFSDDLSMRGAVDVEGDIVSRANKAMNAGCDMLLICNDPKRVKVLLESDFEHTNSSLSSRLNRLRARPTQ